MRSSAFAVKRGEQVVSHVVQNLWMGMTRCLSEYYMIYVRALLVYHITSFLVLDKITGYIISKPLVQLFTYFRACIYHLQMKLGYATHWLTMRVVGGQQGHKWYNFVYTVVSASIVEEIFYQLCVLQVLKTIHGKIYSAACSLSTTATKKEQTNQSEVLLSKPKLISPWSVISSILFGIARIDPYEYAEGRNHLAVYSTRAFVCFVDSLAFYCPIYETYGIFAAIGAHAARNTIAWSRRLGFFGILSNTYLIGRFVTRCLKCRSWNSIEVWLIFAYLAMYAYQ